MALALFPGAVDIGSKSSHPRISYSRSVAVGPASDAWLACMVQVLASTGRLTPAERCVLEPLLLGRSYDEIATILNKSAHTVGVQVKQILRRLGASNSRDLLRVFLCALDRNGNEVTDE